MSHPTILEWTTLPDGTVISNDPTLTPAPITQEQQSEYQRNPSGGIPSAEDAVKAKYGDAAVLPTPTPTTSTTPAAETPAPTPEPAPEPVPVPEPEPIPVAPVAPPAVLPEHHVAVHVDRITEAKDMLHKIEHGFLIGWTEITDFLKKLV